MPLYRCLFLREDGQVARVEELNSYDDGDAHRDAVRLLTRTGDSQASNCGVTAGRWTSSSRLERRPLPIRAPATWRPSSAGSLRSTNSAIAIFFGTTSRITSGTRSGTRESPNSRGGSTPLVAPARAPSPPISPGPWRTSSNRNHGRISFALNEKAMRQLGKSRILLRLFANTGDDISRKSQ
jgi:hypothetical protein